MRKLTTLTAAAALAVGFGYGGAASADPYADAAVLVYPAGDDCPTAGGFCDTSGDDGDNGADALGMDDSDEHSGAVGTNAAYTSLGFNTDTGLGGVLTLDFTDNACLNLTGDDLQVFEVSHGENYRVDVGIIPGALVTVAASVTGDALVNAGVAFNQVRITALDSVVNTTMGADIDAIECLSPLDVTDITKAFEDHVDDAGNNDEINITGVAFDAQQFKAFSIEITNNTGTNGGFAGLTFIDVVPAEFDLDSDAEDFDNDSTINNDCADNTCDGVEVTVNAADCTATGAEHTNNGNGPAKLQPDIITIDASGLDDTESCEITVWVMTDDDQPGKGRNKTNNGQGPGNPDYTPTSCQDTTIVLNDGVKVFDASMNLLLQDDDSLELTCLFP